MVDEREPAGYDRTSSRPGSALRRGLFALSLVLTAVAAVVLTLHFVGRDRPDKGGTARRAGAARVSGRVLLPGGAPAVGARVTLAIAFSPRLHVTTPPGAEALTDADGRFSIADIHAPPGSSTDVYLACRLDTAHGTLAQVHGTPLVGPSAVPASTISLVPLAERSEGPTLVRVRGPDGRPVASGRVSGFRRSGPPDERRWHYESTEGIQAGFATGLSLAHSEPEHEVMLVIRGAEPSDGAASAGTTVVGPLDGRLPLLDVTLGPAGTITGRVVDAGGEGIERVIVRVTPVLPAGEPLQHSTAYDAAIAARARTDAAGRFRLEGLARAEHRLAVDPPLAYLRPSDRIVPIDEDDVEVNLVEGVRVTVSVTDSGGVAVEGVRVDCGPDPKGEGTTDRDGRIRMRALPPHPFRLGWLRVVPPLERQDLRMVLLRDLPPDDVAVQLEPGRTVEIRVVDSVGEPIGGPELSLEPTDGWLVRREGNRFVLCHLPLEAFEVQAWRTNGWPVDVVVPAEVERYELTMPDTSLTIRVTGWAEGQRGEGLGLLPSLATEYVNVRKGLRASTSLVPLSDGDLGITYVDLDPKLTYVFRLGPLSDGRAASAIGLRPSGREVVVPLVESHEIEVEVRLPDGASGAHVFCLVPGLRLRGTRREDGTYVIDGVPAGTWPVTVRAVRAGKPASGEGMQFVAAGTRAVFDLR